MIIVKEIKMARTTNMGHSTFYGDNLDVLMTKYINNTHLIKTDIISINVVSDTCAFITHLDKK